MIGDWHHGTPVRDQRWITGRMRAQTSIATMQKAAPSREGALGRQRQIPPDYGLTDLDGRT